MEFGGALISEAAQSINNAIANGSVLSVGALCDNALSA
jgi:hypothetical protein